MAKTIDDYFADWESSVFGFGYGTGEPFVIDSLAKFFSACREDGTYRHDAIEAACGPTVAWLLINRLCRADADVIEYGTSPRFGWLSKCGLALRDYFAERSVEAIVANICERDHMYEDVRCGWDYCNCEGGCCPNPFFGDLRQREIAGK